MSIANAMNGVRNALSGYMPLGEDATDLDRQIDQAALAGFPNEQDRLCDCRYVMDFYERRGANHAEKWYGEPESSWRWRPKKHYAVTRRVVDILCSHLYSPGPTRSIADDDATNEYLESVYRDNLINAFMQRADAASTMLGIAAIQATPSGEALKATGDVLKPIKLQLWGYDQLILYPDAVDCTEIDHVVTIDTMDQRTRYTWWTDEFIRTYLTDKDDASQRMSSIVRTTGGRATRFIPEMSGANPYGRLPFAFVHYELPTNGYMTCGIGEYLAQINAIIDDEASQLAFAVKKFLAPKGLMFDTDPAFKDVSTPMGEFLRVASEQGSVDHTVNARLEYLQAQVDFQGGQDHINHTITTALQTLGVPESLYRLNQSTLPSGAAQVAEQQPLVDYSEARQEPFKRYETKIAEMILAVGGTYYGDASLVKASTDGVNLTCRWPAVTIRTPGPEQDAQDADSIATDKESLLDVVQRRFKLSSKDEAYEHLEQVAEDNERIRALGLGPLAAEDRAAEQANQMAKQQAQDAAQIESAARSAENRTNSFAATSAKVADGEY